MDLQQEMCNDQTLETILVSSSRRGNNKNNMKIEEEKKKGMIKGEGGQKCPRCESVNTKFCYYNNYSLSQPRYFCKSCRRYWTKGGTLRNVPVGGGCRRNKRSSSFSFSNNNNNTHNNSPLIATSLFPYNLSLAPPPLSSFAFGGGLFEGQNGHFNNGGLEGSSFAVENVSKQEMINGDKSLWGFPQMVGESSGVGPEIDFGREKWNGLGPSCPGGLLNTLV